VDRSGIVTRRRVLLVDDERLARQRLRQLLSAAPDFDVVGECEEGRVVLAAVRELRPDVVFLDVNMPLVDGFEVQSAIRDLVKHVVFVTAHPEFAARGFDVEATDYLVKPLTQARFDSALTRVRRAMAGPSDTRVMLGTRQGGEAVAVNEISWIEADGAYVVVHAGGRSHVLRESLTQVLERLRHGTFVRIHRSAAINLSHVRRLQKHKQSGFAAELIDGTRLPISRRKAREVVALLRQDLPNRSEQRGAAGVVSG
jgi:two-component system LytT family response regulator